jgi:putative exporter of polyketide antibiotics
MSHSLFTFNDRVPSHFDVFGGMNWNIPYTTRIWVTALLAVIVTTMITVVAISFRRKEARRKLDEERFGQTSQTEKMLSNFKS